MMAHTYLDVDMLSRNVLFRSQGGELVGAAMYDTDFNDRWYIIHSTSDEDLLRQMIEYVVKSDDNAATVKANANDTKLCDLLMSSGFEKQYSESVLEIDLTYEFSYRLPQGFILSNSASEIDHWKRKLVIHHGFDQEGVPDEASDEVARAEKYLELPEYIKVFAIQDGEYVAHCGVWYENGDTAYIEPVVTVPEHRGKGLGRAVVYEAINRAKKRGAKRAIVYSSQEFYLHLGMVMSSEVGTWVKMQPIALEHQ